MAESRAARAHIARRRLGLLVAGLIVAAAAITVAVIVSAADGTSRDLSVELPDATGIYAGELIREAGIDVGGVASVQPADGGRRARVELSLHAGSWPLRRGSRLTLRWGGTISYLNDYLDLTRAAQGAPYGAGARIPAAAVTVPVQFDTLIDDFTPGVRAGLRSLIVSGGSTLTRARPGLEGTLDRAPAALTQANLLLADLNRSRTQLTEMIGATGHVVDALDRSRPSVQALIHGAAGTMGAVASRATALRQTLTEAPAALARVDTTLGTADRTLDLARRVTGQLAPGVTQLRQTVTPLTQLLARVVGVAPDAQATLSTARRSAPQITALLRKATAVMPAIGSDARQGTGALDCIRPYTPDIVSFFTNWSAFMSASDGHNYIPRVVPAAIAAAPSGAQPDTPAQAVSQFPGLIDAFPQPPGYAAGQPWFQPQCGITAAALNAAADPEAGNPASQPLPVPAAQSQARHR